MKLENNFTIDAPVEKAWQALNNPETVAPCFPGATLTSYEGDSFAGTVKVKLGPIAMTYKGKGTYVSRDEAAHEVVIEANGRDSRGNGTANATVTASLAAEGADRTAVSMITDMTITGKPAQFGRGVIADVADKIIGTFAACVARKLAPAAEEPVAAPAAQEPVAVSAAASEATSDIATSPPRRARRAAAPTGGSEAISDTVSERVSTNGAAAGATETEAPATDMTPGSVGTAEALGTPGATEAEAPTTDMTPGSVGTAEALGAPGATEAEAPTTDMTPGSAGTGEVLGAPGASGATEAQAPTTDMEPDPATTSAVTAARTGGTGLRAPVRSEVDAIDLLDHAGAPVLQRLLPVLGGGLLLVLIVLLVRRLRAG
jgi:uncharacterized protein